MKKDKKPSQSVLFHSGQLFLVENTKKGQEEYYLARFLESEQGKQWIARYHVDVNSKISSESPDFVFTTENGNKIGLELTSFIFKDSMSKQKSHAENIKALYRVGNKIVEHFLQKENIPLSLLIEYYDERKWSPNWQKHLEYCYNPTTPIFDIDFEKLKEIIIQRIKSKGVPNWGVNKEYIELGKYAFMVTFDKFYEPYTNVRVNSIGLSVDDPFDELQQEIDKKNHKYASYLKQCDVCHLLVISEDSGTGNCVTFSHEILQKEFNSSFLAVYLMDFGEFNVINIYQLSQNRRLFSWLILWGKNYLNHLLYTLDNIIQKIRAFTYLW